MEIDNCQACSGQGYKNEWLPWDSEAGPFMVDCEHCNGTGEVYPDEIAIKE